MLHRLELHHVADKIGLPDPAGLDALVNILPGLTEFPHFAAESIRKDKRVIKNKIKVTILVDRLGRARQRDESCGSVESALKC